MSMVRKFKETDKNNKEPKKFCDEISQTFRSLTSILNLSNDDFIRTTEIFKICDRNMNRLIKSVIFIWASILDGILFQMKPIMIVMKLKKKWKIIKNFRLNC